MEQLNIFGMLYQDFKIDKKVRLIELFAGVGSQAMAVRDLGIEFEHHKVVEFDKYAINSYNAIHHTNFEKTDIRDVHCDDLDIVEKDKFTYLLTHSHAKIYLRLESKKGMSKGSGTRSGLLWEVERILNECEKDGCLPQVLLMENVPDVISVKNYDDFMMWYHALEKMGYQSYYKVMNAKNYGIPQNRERCFMVSILGEYNYTFPEEIPLTIKLRNLLEEQVDEKYFLSDLQVQKFKNSSYNTTRSRLQEKDYADTLAARDYKDPKCVQVSVNRVGGLFDKDGKRRQAGSVYDANGLSPTLDTSCDCLGVAVNKPLRVRKLTPKECWRLMGFNDEDFNNARQHNSDSQLYKQAGNSIVKQVLMAIFKQMI